MKRFLLSVDFAFPLASFANAELTYHSRASCQMEHSRIRTPLFQMENLGPQHFRSTKAQPVNLSILHFQSRVIGAHFFQDLSSFRADNQQFWIQVPMPR